MDGTCTLCVGRSCTGFLLSLAGAAAADEAPLPIVIGLPLFAVRARKAPASAVQSAPAPGATSRNTTQATLKGTSSGPGGIANVRVFFLNLIGLLSLPSLVLCGQPLCALRARCALTMRCGAEVHCFWRPIHVEVSFPSITV